MVKGEDEWGEQTPACSPLKIRITCTNNKVPSCGNVRELVKECVVLWSNCREQNSRGCSGERVKGLLVLSVSCVLGTVLAGGRGHREQSASASRSLWAMEETDTDTSTRMRERKYCYHRKGFTEEERATSRNREGGI